MQISFFKIFLHFSVVNMLYFYGMSYNDALFRTKTSKYTLRGELKTPRPLDDYCRRGLCPPGVKHIACNNPFVSKT